MMLRPDVLLAILAMAGATFACRYGGYWLFRQIKPTPALRAALGYIPGALFVSYVTPALVGGGPMQWIGAVAAVAAMLLSRDLSLAVFCGTAAAWAWWSWA